MADIALIKAEINKQIGDPETFSVLLATTFKGLDGQTAKRAMLEAVMRGFTFDDFLKKNIYATPFSGGYSLVTSIDYSRKVGQKSGVVGKSAPLYTFKADGQIDSCTVTIKKMVGEYVGEFTATVFFDEYSTGRNLWKTKPKTMIAKVAEMHALRMACPEELAQSYVEEEMQSELHTPEEADVVDLTEWGTKLEATTTKDELAAVWVNVPGPAKPQLQSLKDSLKLKYEDA